MNGVKEKRKETGRLGEEKAAELLKEKGYRILERNFRFRGGEIDIVALNAGTLVFVEVKTSRTPRFGDPVEWVDARKQQHLIKAAECYLQNHHCGECRCRFDVVAVTYEADGAVCRHIEDAF